MNVLLLNFALHRSLKLAKEGTLKIPVKNCLLHKSILYIHLRIYICVYNFFKCISKTVQAKACETWAKHLKQLKTL